MNHVGKLGASTVLRPAREGTMTLGCGSTAEGRSDDPQRFEQGFRLHAAEELEPGHGSGDGGREAGAGARRDPLDLRGGFGRPVL